MFTVQRKVVANARSALWPDFGQLYISACCGPRSNSVYLLRAHSDLKAVLLYDFGIVSNIFVAVLFRFMARFKAMD